MLVDTHCHIYKEYYNYIEQIIEKINKSEISYIINNACNFKTSLEVLELSKIYQNMYCSIGLHPSENFEEIEEIIKLIIENLNNKKMIAIGEIGLDYYYGKKFREEQIRVFKRQLEIAEKYNLPVIIHSREATGDTLSILKEFNVKGIIHCFNGSLEIAQEYIKMGFKIGINGIVTFKNCNLINVLQKLNINDFVFETDSPYLTPEPNRGKRNDPTYVLDVVKFVSEKLEIDKELLINASYKSIKDLFNI